MTERTHYAQARDTDGGIDVVVPREYNAAVDLVDRHLVEGRADKVAFIDQSGELSYAELASRCNRVVNMLTALAMRMEERALLCLLDTNDFPAIFLGAIKAGVVPVPVSTLLTPSDYEHLLRDSRARVVFVSHSVLPNLEPALARSAFIQHVVVVGACGADHPYSDFERLLAGAADKAEAAPTNRDDVAFWLYSSGSTGAPKAAVHLHSSLVQTAARYARATLGLCESDVVFSTAKLSFAYGLGNTLTFPLFLGATAIMTAERPTSSTTLRILREHQPTVFAAVPTLFVSLLADPGLASGLARPPRLSISAGEALPAHVGAAWRERVGTDVLDGIGSTEMLHIFISNRPGDVRYGTTGKPVDGYAVKLLDESGAEGSSGLLWVSGPSAASGYWCQRQRSLSVFQGAWTSTGDYYTRDSDGYYAFLGRSDDMLKVKGMWVSPVEVEASLTSHELVREAAVVGFADRDDLIRAKAFVVLNDANQGSETLVRALQDHVKQQLAHFKCPQVIEFVSALPKTATGKIQRYKLRA